MKSEIVPIEQKPKFVPFELKIQVETLDDLNVLWHRFNISDSIVRKHTSCLMERPYNEDWTIDILHLLDKYPTG